MSRARLTLSLRRFLCYRNDDSVVVPVSCALQPQDTVISPSDSGEVSMPHIPSGTADWTSVTRYLGQACLPARCVDQNLNRNRRDEPTGGNVRWQRTTAVLSIISLVYVAVWDRVPGSSHATAATGTARQHRGEASIIDGLGLGLEVLAAGHTHTRRGVADVTATGSTQAGTHIASPTPRPPQMWRPHADSDDIVLILAHNKEDTSWTARQPYDYVVKSQCCQEVGTNRDDWNTQLGRQGPTEAFAYLSFIVENYDRLPKHMLFMHGHDVGWHQIVRQQSRWPYDASENTIVVELSCQCAGTT